MDENEKKEVLYFYGYRLEHLADIAWALQTAGLTEQDIERFLKDYGLMYEKAKEAAFKVIGASLERSIERMKKEWKGADE